MGYLSDAAIAAMGFKHVGRHVKISDKASIYNCDRISIGDYSRIDDFCVVSGTVTIGRNVFMGVYSHAAGGLPGLELRDFATLAYGCHVLAASDDYSGATMTNPTIPQKYKQEIRERTIVDRHCILGTSSIVFPGVHVAEGCSVGAHTLVLDSTEPWHIYIGIPARKLKPRKRDLLDLEQQFLAEEQAEANQP